MEKELLVVFNRKDNIEKLTLDAGLPFVASLFSSICDVLSLNFEKIADEMIHYFSSGAVDQEGISDLLIRWHPVLDAPENVAYIYNSYGRYTGNIDADMISAYAKIGYIVNPDTYDAKEEIATLFKEILLMQAYADLSGDTEVLRNPDVFRAFIDIVAGGESSGLIQLPGSDYYSATELFPEASINSAENLDVVRKFVQELGLYHADVDVYVFDAPEISISYCATALHQLYLWKYVIKRCKNCGRFFTPLNRSDEIYCNNPSPQDPGRSCKEYGTQKLWYDRLKKDETKSLWRKVSQAKQKMASRYDDIPGYAEQYELFKAESKQWKADIKNGTKTEEQFMEWLNSQKEKKV